MSKEVAVQTNGEVPQFTPEQSKLIMDTICKNATQDEAKLFFYRAKSMRLDPLKPGQIHFVKYGNSPGTIVVGIEGFRSIAGRSGKHVGTKRGVLRDSGGKALGGWAEVFRSDWKEPARLEVSLSEYSTGKGPWQKMPESMIQKVAEAGALRMAFPDDLGGVYTNEEMDQADSGVRPEQPGPEDGDQTPGHWTFPMGKWKQRSLEEVYNDPKNGPKALASYVNWLEDSARKKNEDLSPAAQDVVDRISEFLGAMENAPLEAEVVETEDDLPF